MNVAFVSTLRIYHLSSIRQKTRLNTRIKITVDASEGGGTCNKKTRARCTGTKFKQSTHKSSTSRIPNNHSSKFERITFRAWLSINLPKDLRPSVWSTVSPPWRCKVIPDFPLFIDGFASKNSRNISRNCWRMRVASSGPAVEKSTVVFPLATSEPVELAAGSVTQRVAPRAKLQLEEPFPPNRCGGLGCWTLLTLPDSRPCDTNCTAWDHRYFDRILNSRHHGLLLSGRSLATQSSYSTSEQQICCGVICEMVLGI